MTDDVKKEILAMLEETIENEVAIMGDDYTTAEVASEVLLSYAQSELGLRPNVA